jgi:hypothetical protein
MTERDIASSEPSTHGTHRRFFSAQFTPGIGGAADLP